MRSILRVILIGAVCATVFATPALAQDSGTYVTGEVIENEPEVLAVESADLSAESPAVLGATQERSEGSALPVTGGDAVGLAFLAVVMLAVGGALVMVNRTRRLTVPST
jgi:hypothetical protein